MKIAYCSKCGYHVPLLMYGWYYEKYTHCVECGKRIQYYKAKEVSIKEGEIK